MANVSTRSHCDLVLKINKLIQKFEEKTRRDPGHGVRIHIVNFDLEMFILIGSKHLDGKGRGVPPFRI